MFIRTEKYQTQERKAHSSCECLSGYRQACEPYLKKSLHAKQIYGCDLYTNISILTEY